MTLEAPSRRQAYLALVLAGAGMASLHLLGGGILAAPPLTAGEGLARWLEVRDPIVVAMVAVRLAGLALGYHLALTTVLIGIGRVLRLPRLTSWADAMTLPMFRGLAGRAMGLALSASTLATGALPSAGAAPPAAVTAAPDGPLIERIALPTPGAQPDATGTATISPTDGGATVSPAAPAPATPLPSSSSTAAPAPGLHQVQPGDHLWGIAADALHTSLGRAPTDAEVDPFWREVIVANPQIADPDLIFPGDLVVVPPVHGPRS